MVRIYSAPEVSHVHLAKNVLENSGIECIVRGEHLASAAGGVAPIDAWVELWLVDEYLADEAEELLRAMRGGEYDEEIEAWICPQCIDWREGQFSHCWSCGAERL